MSATITTWRARLGLLVLGLTAALGACRGEPAASEGPAAAATRPAATTRAAAAPAVRVGDPADWCGGHALPESMCTKCNPELRAKFEASGDWCAAHELPESACPKCNPMQPPPKPGSSATAPPARVGDPADWCGGHALPESMCTKCNPELRAKFEASGDWCAAHELPESACPKCNPMQPPPKPGSSATAPPARVGDPADWCGGHALPESMCTKCNPELRAKFEASGDWCAEHELPESVCPKCNPMTPPGGGASGKLIRLRDPGLAEAIGIETVVAASAALGSAVTCTARVSFDRNRMADVRSAVPGIVRSVAVDLGQQVAEGDLLFTLESVAVGDLQARRRAVRARIDAAKANRSRQEELARGAIASQRQVEVARRELSVARADLRAIDQSLRLSGASSGGKARDAGAFEVRAPLGGTVVKRPALVGTYASAADSLATVADTSVMWVLLDVPEWDAASVRKGQPVTLTVDGVPGRTFTGTVTWVAAEVDPRTRSVEARAEVRNDAGLIRAGQFARGRVTVEASRGATTVPLDAVQRVDEGSVVFVQTGEGIYEPRSVELGRSDGRRVQITGEVSPGDAVVTTGAFLLRTELSRESIGAGCCEVGPRKSI